MAARADYGIHEQGRAGKRRGLVTGAAESVAERLRPPSARPATPSRRALLQGAGAALFTTALLATGEVVPVTPYRVSAAAPPPHPTGDVKASPTTPDTLYQTFVGTDFQPEITADGYAGLYSTGQLGGGQVYQSTGSPANFSARVDLPQGATITEVIFYVIRNDANPMFVDMAGYGANGGFGIGSANPPGNSTIQAITLSPLSNTTVDNSAFSYVLEWLPGTVGATQRLIGARVGYTLPGLAQVYGSAQAGSGVRGDSATGNGVIGNSAGTGTVAGVLGSTNTTLLADQRAGVAGMSDVATVPAVYGHATVGDTNGVYGSGANKGAGVYGINSNAVGIGVQGFNDFGSAVQGNTSVGTGVLGQSSAAGGTGVKGVSSAGFPIIGNVTGTGSETNPAAGVLGSGTKGPGVQGQSTSGHGLVGTTNDALGHAGLIGNANNTGGVGLMGIAPNYGTMTVGKAGDFYGNVKINGGTLSAPVMQAEVKHAGDGTYRALSGVLSPEGWIEDFGEAKLTNGSADVKLDRDFAALVETNGYQVFLTEYDDHNNLFVTQRAASGFVVQAKETASTTGVKAPTKAVNGTFGYRVVARRKDIKNERLAKVAASAAPARPTPFTIPETPTGKP